MLRHNWLTELFVLSCASVYELRLLDDHDGIIQINTRSISNEHYLKHGRLTEYSKKLIYEVFAAKNYFSVPPYAMFERVFDRIHFSSIAEPATRVMINTYRLFGRGEIRYFPNMPLDRDVCQRLEDDLSLKKRALLCGPPGSGKTVLARSYGSSRLLTTLCLRNITRDLPYLQYMSSKFDAGELVIYANYQTDIVDIVEKNFPNIRVIYASNKFERDATAIMLGNFDHSLAIIGHYLPKNTQLSLDDRFKLANSVDFLPLALASICQFMKVFECYDIGKCLANFKEVIEHYSDSCLKVGRHGYPNENFYLYGAVSDWDTWFIHLEENFNKAELREIATSEQLNEDLREKLYKAMLADRNSGEINRVLRLLCKIYYK